MAQEEKLPDSIDVDGVKVNLDHPVIKELLGKVSNVEKKKLYDKLGELESLRGEVAELRNFKSAEDARRTTVPPTAPTQEQPKPTTVSEELTKSLTPDGMRALLKEAFTVEFDGRLKESVKPIYEALSLLKKQQVEAYRKDKLVELGDAVIPQLVRGESTEEIDRSIEESKAIRAQYVTNNPPPATPPAAPPVKPEVPNPQTTTTPQTPNFPATPPTVPPLVGGGLPSGNPSENGLDAKAVSEMSVEEYAKQREGLLGKASGLAKSFQNT